jgi:hypothetical protein
MVTILVSVAVGFVAGWITGYFVLRNNPKIKKKIDGSVDGYDKA